MRILHILNELKPSGAETMLVTAASYWRGQGLAGNILSTGINPGPYASALEKAGYQIHHIPFSASYRFLLSAYRFLKRHPHDVIHIHPERGNFWYAVVAYMSGYRSIIRTAHNIFPFRSFLRVERYIQRWIMRRILGVRTVTIGSSVRDSEWKTYRNPSDVIPNWYDSSKCIPPSLMERSSARKALGIPDDQMIVTSIGGCWSYKNHSSIIKAMTQLPASARVIYLHVGQEEEGNPERRLAARVGASERVRFLGIVPDIIPVLHASDVYIMPSLYEGFGIAAIEAMGAGLPAILSDVAGLRDYRDTCGDIYWVNPTSESIARAIVHFLEMPTAYRREAGIRLSQAVHSHFALENGAGAYLRLYKTCKDK